MGKPKDKTAGGAKPTGQRSATRKQKAAPPADAPTPGAPPPAAEPAGRPLAIDMTRGGKSGRKTTVVVALDGRPLFRDVVDLDREPDRRAFAAAVVAALPAADRPTDPVDVEALVGVLLADLVALAAAPETGKPPPAADRLVGLALAAGVELVHTPDQEAVAIVPVDGRREVYLVRSAAFRSWLARLQFTAEGKAVNAEALQTAVNTLEGVALFDRPEQPVYLRVAPVDGGLALDLADGRWRCVLVTAAGWRVADDPPVLFRRSPTTFPLPDPDPDGDLAALKRFLRVKGDDAWLLVVAWLAAALRPAGPYPVLLWAGEAGTSKTTSGRVLRRLVDPAKVDLRRQPREERDLAVASRSGWMIAYDNLSSIPTWLSDALCVVATGGGFGTRTLYSNDEETCFDFCRPVQLTSIADVVGQPDLLDRTLAVELAPIPDAERQEEAEFWAAFEAARPGILGGLLTVVANALALLPAVRAERRPKPRMADFALFGEAVARAVGEPPGRFLEVLDRAREANAEAVLQGSDLATVFYRWAKRLPAAGFRNTPTALYEALVAGLPDRDRPPKWWPANAQKLSSELRRIAPALRRKGVEVSDDREKTKARTRVVVVRMATQPPEGERPIASDSSDDHATGLFGNGFGAGRNGHGDASDVRPQSGDASDVRPQSGDASAPADATSAEGRNADATDPDLRPSADGCAANDLWSADGTSDASDANTNPLSDGSCVDVMNTIGR